MQHSSCFSWKVGLTAPLFRCLHCLHSLLLFKTEIGLLGDFVGHTSLFAIWNMNPQMLQSSWLQIIMTVVFPILTLCISPWATKGAWERLLSLGSGSVLTKKPLGHVHPVYMPISPLIALERRKFGVSDIFVSRKCCLFPWEAWTVLYEHLEAWSNKVLLTVITSILL